MPLKVLLAQSKSDPAAFEANFQRIEKQINQATQQSADLLIFPELMLCGYTHLDLVNHADFLNENLIYLNKVKQLVPASLTVIVGFADFEGKKIFNAAAIISDGDIKQVIHKQLLPTYDIFDESRYFTPGESSQIIDINGEKIGIAICEDLWDEYYDRKVYPALIEQGAKVLVNLSASPYRVGKLEERICLVEKLVAEKNIDFIYVNLVGGYDGYEGEVVFDGQSFVRSASEKYFPLLKLAEEDSSLIDLGTEASLSKDDVLSSFTDIEELYLAIVLGIKDYFRRNRMTKAYIGLSGGIDSAVCLALLIKALGSKRVVAVIMPSHLTSQETKNDAQLMAEQNQVSFKCYPISELYQQWFESSRKIFEIDPNDLACQNIQARLRGAVLMSFTNQDPGAVVITTGNKTELALGYCTIYGDMCGALAPIADLNKTRVYQLAELINARESREVIPKSIIDRAPTAELAPNQTDEANLPAEYERLAPLVDEIIESKYSYKELCSKYDPNVVDQTLRLIKINEFKRRQAAPGIRLTSKAFGMGRRVPMTYS